MDLSTDQKVMGVQGRYVTEFNERHAFKFKNTFKETDIKEKNHLFNSLKTEENANHDHDCSSLFQVKCPKEKGLEIDNSFFSFSSLKKAMDLRTHNRTLDGRKRTIFEDAEYFAKNYRYQLLPITFVQVDETIIQSEHNYSLFSLASESEPEGENFSRTMDYSQVKEKNYKRRRTEFEEELVEGGALEGHDDSGRKSPAPLLVLQNESSAPETDYKNTSFRLDVENSIAGQPLDLSAAPLVQEEKTELRLLERPNSIFQRNACDNDEVAQLDSDKGNLNSELNGIRVTITRPDEKENYQPCDLFLNDIARLVPWLIDKDCFEVDILDRTCDRSDEFQRHRLYYVISESTWRLFQKTNERVILTNDQSLGQPLRKAEKDEKPSYLVFDQFSLAKCLAEYCQEIGGCFEYTCFEEGRSERGAKGKEGEEFKINEMSENESKEIKTVGEASRELCTNLEKISEKDTMEGAKEESPQKEETQEFEKGSEYSEEKSTKAEKEEVSKLEVKAAKAKNEKKLKTVKTCQEAGLRQREILKQVNAEVVTVERSSKFKAMKKRTKRVKQNEKSVKLKKSKTSLSKSSTRAETSQKKDESVSRRARRRTLSATPTEEPPDKRSKSFDVVDVRRRTRSGKPLEKGKTEKLIAKKKENAGPKGRGRREKEVEETKVAGRSLRSQMEARGVRKVKGRERKKRG